MTVLVDSDILIEVSRGRNTEILAKWDELSRSGSAVLYSPITEAELWAGARLKETASITNLFGALTCVSIDSHTGRQAGLYIQQYGKSHALEMADALIAAGAIVNRAKLWTRNRQHFPMKDLSFFQ